MLPDIAGIRFKMDLFAEDQTNRTIVEIQKIDLAYNYSRFLHYFMANLLDIQRDSKTYNFAKAVYLIVIVTGPAVLKDLDGERIICDALLTNVNPIRLGSGKKCKLLKHNMLILNPNYLCSDTPALIRDWLTFIMESMTNAKCPNINLSHRGIGRAARLANKDMLTSAERFEAKEANSRKEKLDETKAEGIQKGREEGIEKGREEGIEKGREEGIEKGREEGIEKGREKREIEAILGLHKKGISTPIISEALNISEKRVQEIIKLGSKR